MPTCPHCKQRVEAQAIACPTCRAVLKAHGHPGIPLHQTSGVNFLCDTCIYHFDNTCNFPKRPYAQDCTLYQSEPFQQLPSRHRSFSLDVWVKRNMGWLILGGILVLILVNALR